MTNGEKSRIVSQDQMERLAQWSMRKPVIALMGEFSAGKSTLLNLLVGRNILPTQVTATRLPPVWLRYGNDEPYRVDQKGNKHPVNLQDPSSIPMNDTRFIRVYCDADILQRCDLMDTPGISDPNIPAEYWINTIGYANSVMWCTHAGQAWRESERSAWLALPKRLRETSILLVTRKDKLVSDADIKKVDRRLQREAGDLFNGRVFISLTNAIRARENNDGAGWSASGAQSFAELLEQIIEGVGVQHSYMVSRYQVGDRPVRAAAPAPVAEVAPAPIAEEVPKTMPTRIVPMRPSARAEAPVADVQDDAPASVEDVFVLQQAVSEPVAEPIANDPFAALHAPKEEPIENDPFAGMNQAEDTAVESLEQPEDDTYEEPAEQFIRESFAADQAAHQYEEPRAVAPATFADASAAGDETESMISRIAMMEANAQDDEPVASPAHIDETAEQPRKRSEMDMIREIWGDVQEHFDVSKTPTLVSTINNLLAQMESGEDSLGAGIAAGSKGASNGVSFGQMDTSGLTQPTRSL